MQSDPTEKLFHELAACPVEERQTRLAALARQSPELHAAVARLLGAHEAAPDFLTPRAVAPDVLPARLGRYQVERELGRGAAGVVYVGVDPDLDRRVALKTLVPTTSGRSWTERLQREARVLASVVHPNIAQVYAIEQIDGAEGTQAVLAMELVPGETLAARLRRGPLPLEDALDCGRQIASALEAAHQRSVVHRDLKPQNIQLTPDGWVKVLDFGLAQLLGAESGRTRSGGTPGYMSPEQCGGEEVDHRSDVWSYAAVLAEVISGQPIVRGTTLAELLDANRYGETHVDLPGALPGPVHSLIHDCLERDPGQRVASAAQARHVLEEELLRLRAARLHRSTREEPAERSPVWESAGNLPRPLSSFVGREAFADRLASHLTEHRLVTITGPGGAGKTRTSIEIARRESARFPAGVWFVDLGLVEQSMEVPTAVARSLGLRDQAAQRAESDEALAARCVAMFRASPGLVILDNCEHVLAAAAEFVTRLLSLPSELTVVATSRQPLAIAGEEVLPLVPLTLPGVTAARGGELSESVDLFLKRARSRAPDFAPSTEGLDLMGAICSNLDGLPLAIELAAAHARSWSLDELLRRVRDGGSLAGLGPPRQQRHHSLHDLVDWSYRLLSAKQQLLLQRLSMFRGGWTLAAAESVCGGWGGVDSWEVCDLLTQLVERSLVEPELSRPDPAAAPLPARYRLLETIRSFAAERLQDGGSVLVAAGADTDGTPIDTDGAPIDTDGAPIDTDGAPIDTDHQTGTGPLVERYVDAMAATCVARPFETGPTHFALVRRLEPDYANLVHALELALDAGWLEAVYIIAEGTSYYWFMKGQFAEAFRWIDRVRARRDELRASRSGEELENEARAEIRFLCRVVIVAATGQESALAAQALAEMQERVSRVSDPTTLGRVQLASGIEAWWRSDLDAAERAFASGKPLFEEAEDWGASGVMLGNLGLVAAARGDLEQADRYNHQYLELSRKVGNRHAEGRMLLNMGWLSLQGGELSEARASLEQALTIVEAAGDVTGVGGAHQSLGELSVAEGRLEEAREHLEQSCRWRLRTGDRYGLASTIMHFGRLADREGQPEDAAVALGCVLTWSDASKVEWNHAVRAKLDDWRAELTERLGEAVMEAAFERGASLGLDGLVSEISSASRSR